VTPRHPRMAATRLSHFFRRRERRHPTGDEGVASTFRRLGVAATRRPVAEFGLKRIPKSWSSNFSLRAPNQLKLELHKRPTVRPAPLIKVWPESVQLVARGF